MQIDIQTLDIDLNFWDLYPEFKTVEPFSSWYQADKSKTKDSSSKRMWFLAVGYHPSSSLSRMERGQMQKILSRDYLRDETYYQKNAAELDQAVAIFLECTTTGLQRQLIDLEQLFDKRGAFIRSQEYGNDNWEDLDKMFAATGKIKASFDEVRKQIAAEQEGGSSRGDKNLSASDLKLG